MKYFYENVCYGNPLNRLKEQSIIKYSCGQIVQIMFSCEIYLFTLTGLG